jgi:sarcosine oxidase subunit alpha
MGLWFRPRFYSANGKDAATAAVVEAERVRSLGGIADCSTLGKLEIAGPDAAAFLDEIYLSRPSTLAVGRSRYAVQLREDGMVLDDGLVLRLAEDRFLATTSSGHGLHVLSHLEHHRAHRGALRVSIADVTDCWAVIAVAGRAAADALRMLLERDPLELSPMAFWDWSGPLQGVGMAGQGGQRLRVLRAGFSGELSFELHCSPALALPLWEALRAGGLAPYGLDALDILRVEKGYLTTSEITGQVTPLDLGMEAMVAKAGPCIGLELLQRPAFQEPQRPRLVGLRAVDGQSSFLAGAQLTVGSKDRVPVGYVTSSVFSASLGETLALALAARDVAPLGAMLWARDPLRGRDVQVRVVAPVHFDPAGERLRGRY